MNKFLPVSSRGYLKNLVDVCGWRFLGLCRPDNTDWTAAFDMDSANTSITNTAGRLGPKAGLRDNYQYV